MAPSHFVKPPRVAASPAALECKLLSIQQLVDLDGKPVPRWMVLGQVVGIFMDDAYIRDGRFDTAGANPIARCGYADYAEVDSLFSIQRPTGRLTGPCAVVPARHCEERQRRSRSRSGSALRSIRIASLRSQ